MVCDVCENVFVLDPNSTSPENSILECTRCKIKVHQLCYGVVKYSKKWLCSFCKVTDPEEEKTCALCPSTTGPLKKTTDNEFVHVVCALFTPGVVVGNPTTTMQPVNLRNVIKKLYGLRCYICEKKGIIAHSGACVTCSKPKCKRNMHVTCAQVASTLKEGKSVNGNIRFIAYCEEHLDNTAPRISFSSIAVVMNNRKKLNDNKVAKKQNSLWIVSVSICNINNSNDYLKFK